MCLRTYSQLLLTNNLNKSIPMASSVKLWVGRVILKICKSHCIFIVLHWARTEPRNKQPSHDIAGMENQNADI